MDSSVSSSTSSPRRLPTLPPGAMVPNLLPPSPTVVTASHEGQLTSSPEDSSPPGPLGSPDRGSNDQTLVSSSPPPTSPTSDKPNVPPAISFATAGLIATAIKRRPAPVPGTSEDSLKEGSSDSGSGMVEKEVHQKRSFFRRHWRICSTFIVLAISAIGVGMGWAMRLHTFDGTDSPYGTGIFLWSNLVSVDADQQTMVMDWIIFNYTCGQQSMSTPCPDVNLYFDQNLIRPNNGGGPSDNNIPSAPIFTLNGTEFASGDLLANSRIFRTNVVISNYATGRTTQSYPFDKYNAAIFVFAQVINNTSQFVPVNINVTTGIAVGFNAKLETSYTGLADSAVFTNIEITRGPVVRVYALFIVIAIWLVTLTFLAACIAVVFLRMAMSAAILALPVTTLFAFTQLRSTLPRAPAGFGADIDFVGILPCLAILTFCTILTVFSFVVSQSVLMVAVFLFRDPEKGLDPERDFSVHVKQEKQD
ncbi:hypothetical protein JAAARDRAFT_190720 [Jaapia argillacea MUCL 33604]|uniref:Transmembrane protein n=1 Tax=Jaapia argillacea MUCL 33604 TaxID=933084 RepID=A0A067Q4X8_9AGAM|nr:hypothetical protein JAAARDRAFT_190720 [Jaapia argillacea MUCL 33604]